MKMPEKGVNINSLVIAGPRDGLRWSVTFLLDRMVIKYVLCPNIYLAVPWISRRDTDTPMLVFIRPDSFGPEGRRLIELCFEDKGIILLCYYSGKTDSAYSQMILKKGGFIADNLKSLEVILEKLVKNIGSEMSVNENPPREDENKHDFELKDVTLTKEEIDALLGAG